jgi:hypothetical protein
MGRNSYRFRDLDRQRDLRRRINPIWYGVGFLLLTVLGILGYLFSGWFLIANAQQGWIYLPPQVMVVPRLEFLPPGVVVQFVVGLISMMLAFGVISFVYAILFPIQPGETDVPPLKRRPGRRHRSR